MRSPFPVTLLGIGALLVALAYALTFLSTGDAAPWPMAAGATLVLTGLGLLGAGPNAPRLRAAVLVACSCTFAGFALALAAAPPTIDGPLLLGLPRITALMLLACGAVPMLLLPIAYAWAFPREVQVSTDA